MSSLHSHTRFTYEDYLLFPENGRRRELIDGEHYATPSPKTKHQKVSGTLFLLLGTHVKRSKVGYLFAAPTDVVLSDLDVVQPDLLFITAARASIVTENNIQGPPDLMIEILSETTRKTDEIMKRKLYERYGIREYWIVDPELETVKVYLLTDTGFVRTSELTCERGETLTSPLFPILTIALTALFE
ncbi:MAG: Uma2 family endonuclease [Nitrospiraceae bacterium]